MQGGTWNSSFDTWACTNTDRAPKGVPVEACRLSSELERRFRTLLVDFHPSVSLIASRFSAATIWETNQLDDDWALQRWGPEAALVARSSRDVAIRRLPAGGYAFLNVLSGGATVATAIDAAISSNSAFGVGANLVTPVESRIAIGLHGPA